MVRTLYLSYVMSTKRRILLLLPLIVFYLAAEFWHGNAISFTFMVRDNESFSLWELFNGAWMDFSLWETVRSPGTVFLAWFCAFWWLKPSCLRYILPALFALIIGSVAFLDTWSWYNNSLYEFPAYRQQIPFWFPLSPITFR